jgi:hypothetical protein
MRTQEDLILVRVNMTALVSLDLERITEDPAWAAIADNVNLSDSDQREQALFNYLASYIQRHQLFGGSVFMPATNGPSDINIINMEEITNGTSNG